MTENAKMPPPHARRGRAVVRDGGFTPLARSDLDQNADVPTEAAHDFTVLVRRERFGFRRRPNAFAVLDRIRAEAPVLLHRQLLPARGDEHHTRQTHYLMAVNRAAAALKEDQQSHD